MAQRKKIGLIFASGSLLSIKGNKSIFFVDQEKDIEQWLSEVPEVRLIAEIQTYFLQGEGEQFELASIERILEILSRESANHDGFVVLVRGEQMIRAAAAVEFMLQGFGKPVIFTGSRYSPQAIAYQDIRKIVKMGGLGLRSNLINAAQIAVSEDFPATAIMYGNKIMKPTHAAVNDFQAMNLYRSVDDDYLGKIDFGISLSRKKIPVAPAASLRTQFAPGVFFTESMYLENNAAFAGKPGKGKEPILVLKLRQNETVPLERLEQLKARYRTVVLFNEYYVLDHTGVSILSRLTWPAAEMKVRWAHTVFPDRVEFEKALSCDVIQELIQL